MKKELLSDWNVVSKGAKTEMVFSKLISNFTTNTDIPSEYIMKLWTKYKELPKMYQTNSMNGSIFEAIIYTIFIKEKVTPIYFQAELEGIALKEVYKRAETYLITLDNEQEIDKFERKVADKDIRGIDRCINAYSSEFDDIIKRLKNSGVDEPPDIKAIKSASEIKE